MNDTAFNQLVTSLRGVALRPSDSAYDDARRIWNGTVDKHPAVVVRCEDGADVVKAIKFGRAQEFGLSVRGGGHHVAGSALLEDGLVIDLSHMRAIRVDPTTARVQCQGGALIGDVDRESQKFGLAVPLGVVSATGIGGLTLAGGFGWMRRTDGLACDNLVSADIVLADGRLLHTSVDENPDLFWALRGGGWDLGVVVSFEFRARRLGPDVFMTFVTYPLQEGGSVLRAFRDRCAEAPAEVGALAVCWTFPAAEPFPRQVWNQPFIGVIGPFIGSVAEGERAMQPFRRLGTVLTDMSGPQSWVDVQRFFDADYPNGRRYYWKSTYLRRLSDAGVDTVLALADTRPSSLSSIDIWPLGGAQRRVTSDQSPLGHRDAAFAVAVESNWDDPSADNVNVEYARDAIARLEPFSTGGSYLNFDDPDDATVTAASFGPALERLLQVKRRYDPDNTFRSRRGLMGAPRAAVRNAVRD